MQRFIDVTRAAKLAGVPRAEIRRLIAVQTLTAPGGKICYDDLIRVFPEIEHSRVAMVEIVSQIKDDAIVKGTHMHSTGQPTDFKALRTELLQTRQDASYYRQLSGKYKQILIELRPKLAALQEKSEHKHRIQAVIDWFVHKTKELW